MRSCNWEIASTGSYIIREGYDELICTVYKNKYCAWCVVVNVRDNYGQLAPHYCDRLFTDVDEAKAHAEYLLSIREQLEPTKFDPALSPKTFSDWRQQKGRSNGRPTYGRKAGRINLSVKCATTGSWFYMARGEGASSNPEGWYGTPQAAMEAADKKYGS